MIESVFNALLVLSMVGGFIYLVLRLFVSIEEHRTALRLKSAQSVLQFNISRNHWVFIRGNLHGDPEIFDFDDTQREAPLVRTDPLTGAPINGTHPTAWYHAVDVLKQTMEHKDYGSGAHQLITVRDYQGDNNVWESGVGYLKAQLGVVTTGGGTFAGGRTPTALALYRALTENHPPTPGRMSPK